MKKRVHVFYSGSVQGVGFRFTAEMLAREMNITGWARNLPDGRVEITAEGESAYLENFLGKIKTRMARYITKVESKQREATDEFSGFQIVP